MLRLKILLAFTLMLLCISIGYSQQETEIDTTEKVSFFKKLFKEKEDKPEKKVKVVVLPVVLYSPETNWAFGANGQMYFRLSEDTITYTSMAIANFTYTLNKQIITFGYFDLFLKENKIRYSGELGYLKYPNFYWGVGNNTPESNKESFESKIINFKFRWTGSVKQTPFFLGVTYKLQKNFGITYANDSTSLLGHVEQPTGYNGYRQNGLGLAAMWDTRDHNIFPYKGLYVDYEGFYFFKTKRKNSEFIDMTLDVREYVSFRKNKPKPHVVAFQQYLRITAIDPPFGMMAQVGGEFFHRGYFYGRYRDRWLFSTQAEYRFPIYWRFGGTVFSGVAEVAHKFNDLRLDQFKYFGGAGIRFSIMPDDRVNIRVDVGFGRDGNMGIYFKLNEAF